MILGVMRVGIAGAVGITMFTDNATSANRDAVTNDLVNRASRAQQYYRRPSSMGGGEGSFTGLTFDKLSSKPSNSNGRYLINGAVAATQVKLRGVGREKSNATDPGTGDRRVKPDSD